MDDRITILERSLRRTRALAALVGLVLIAWISFELVRRPQGVLDEVRSRRFVLVDDEGRMRAELAQDPKTTQRRARSAGLRIFDSTEHERGGFSTFDDGSVVMAMDAPYGVGDPMPDRIGLVVYSDGSTHINMLDNQTRALARLFTAADGTGGVQVLKWDMDAKQIHVRTLTFDGDERETRPMGDRN